MSENVKVVKIIKTVPGDVFFKLSPVSNQSLVKDIYLTERVPQQTLPIDWALGIFLDNSLYAMYKQGYFTFNDVDGLTHEAIEAGVFFDDALDFTPKAVNTEKDILAILKKGVRSEILKANDIYGIDNVKSVAIAHVSELTQGVIQLLESMFNVQLTMDGE